MKVTIKTNIDPWTEETLPLEFDKKYTVKSVVISGWSTDVYLEEVEGEFNSVIFDDKFQKEWKDAIDWFDEHPHERHCGVFVRDYW